MSAAAPSPEPEHTAPAPREGNGTLPLVFDEPRGRRKPPRHLADLDAEERKQRLVELGLPGFRAKQLSTHYFARLVDDPAEMTDLPAGQRDELVSGLLPELMTPLRTLTGVSNLGSSDSTSSPRPSAGRSVICCGSSTRRSK